MPCPDAVCDCCFNQISRLYVCVLSVYRFPTLCYSSRFFHCSLQHSQKPNANIKNPKDSSVEKSCVPFHISPSLNAGCQKGEFARHTPPPKYEGFGIALYGQSACYRFRLLRSRTPPFLYTHSLWLFYSSMYIPRENSPEPHCNTVLQTPASTLYDASSVCYITVFEMVIDKPRNINIIHFISLCLHNHKRHSDILTNKRVYEYCRNGDRYVRNNLIN